MIENPDSAQPLREQRRSALRQAIIEAFGDALEQGGAGSYAEIAALVGVSERTVYRHFPAREDLFRAVWSWLTGQGGIAQMPRSEDELLAFIRPYFTGFDKMAAHVTMTLVTDEGRQLRKLMRPERVEAFLAATADATIELPEGERRKAAAAIHALQSGYTWLQMREEWDLDGAEAADAVEWAITTLLEDLRRRGDKPLAKQEQ